MIVPLDLPADLLQEVQTSSREQGIAFREFVVSALQAAVARPGRKVSKSFSQRAHDFGTHLESPWTVLAEIETDDYKGRHQEREK
jgi:hypothetical protein